jgi:hypothetical protein
MWDHLLERKHTGKLIAFCGNNYLNVAPAICNVHLEIEMAVRMALPQTQFGSINSNDPTQCLPQAVPLSAKILLCV